MSSILEWLLGNNGPVVIILILTIIVLLLALYKDAKTIHEVLLKAKGLFKKIRYWNVNRKRKKYNETLEKPEYLRWQKAILKTIYDLPVKQFNQIVDSNHQCFYAHSPYSDKNDAYQYEALCFQSENEYRYPFEELYSKRELGIRKLDGSKSRIRQKSSRSQRAFLRMMKPVISFPNNVGYMLEEINLEGNFHFKAYCDVYSENVKTSHILEYELYKLHKKYPEYSPCPKKSNSEATNGCLYLGEDAATFLLDLLPIRKALHQKVYEIMPPGRGFFSFGAGRKSLISVQAMVFCKNYGGKYDVLRFRRSEKVDSKAGFIQFIPSGGFSALNQGVDYDTQYFNFSLPKAIFREFLEECYGEEDFSGKIDESPEKVYAHPIIKQILSQKDVDIYFVGTACSLISLRQELCFIIILDDISYSETIKQNEEAKNIIQFVPSECLSDENFWVHNLSGKDELTDEMLLNCTSAALWNLVRHSKIYRKKIMKEKS